MDAVSGPCRILLRGQPGIFKHQPDPVDGLDHTVVQIHPDAFPFFKDRDLLLLLGHPQVLDQRSDPCGDRCEESRIRFFLVSREMSAQDQQPDHAALRGDRNDRHVVEFCAQVIPLIDKIQLGGFQRIGFVVFYAAAEHTFTGRDRIEAHQAVGAAVSFMYDHAEIIRILIRIEKDFRCSQPQTADDQVDHLVHHVDDVAVVIDKHPPQFIQKCKVVVAFGQFSFPDCRFGIKTGVVDCDPGIRCEGLDEIDIFMGKGSGADLVDQGDRSDLVFIEEDRGEEDGFDDRSHADPGSVIRIEDPETLAFALRFGTDRLIGRDRKDRVLSFGIEQFDL